MKKILILLILPFLLHSIEINKKSESSKSKRVELKSEIIYKVKRDTLDRDGDGITDRFFKRLRDREGKFYAPYKEKTEDNKKESERQRDIQRIKPKSRLR
ncbi:MAG: hypothetical protein ABIM58_01940 [candidate division WOR-3 bacterium]